MSFLDPPDFQNISSPSLSLLERNQLRLAKLEQEGRDLGQPRQLDFKARFTVSHDEGRTAEDASEAAESFIGFAEELGCECVSYVDQWGDWHVSASIKMVPAAPQITLLQKQLTACASEYLGYLDRWDCPAHEVLFWPECSRSNKDSASARAAVLFDGAGVDDPLPHSKAYRDIAKAPALFELVPSEFLRGARALAPANPQATVSAFSQWVYSLYGHAFGSDQDREGGKEAENQIWEQRRTVSNCSDDQFLRSHGSRWSLVHNGLHICGRRQAEYFEIDRLRVNGESLRASPDLIYRDQKQSEFIIVEIKYSSAAIPKNLWPNIWAQLWCYSQLDILNDAKKVEVVGEVWGQRWYRGTDNRVLCLRASVRRDPRVPAYDRFFRRLFDIYRGLG